MTGAWVLLAIAFAAWPVGAGAGLRLRRMAGRRLADAPVGAKRFDLSVVPPLRVWLPIAGAVGLGVAVLGRPVLGLTIASIVATGGWLLISAAQARAALADEAALGRALRLLSAELAAGSRPAGALAAAAASAGRCAAVLLAAARVAGEGGDVPAALLADEPAGALRSVAAAWQVAGQTGAGLAEVIDRVEVDLARRREQRLEVATKLAGARSSAVLLALLPVLGLVLGSAMGARPVAMLFGSAAGEALLCAGVLLDAAGLIWTARIVGRATR